MLNCEHWWMATISSGQADGQSNSSIGQWQTASENPSSGVHAGGHRMRPMRWKQRHRLHYLLPQQSSCTYQIGPKHQQPSQIVHQKSQLFEPPFVLIYNPGAIEGPWICFLPLGPDWQMPLQLKKVLAGKCLRKDVSPPPNGRGPAILLQMARMQKHMTLIGRTADYQTYWDFVGCVGPYKIAYDRPPTILASSSLLKPSQLKQSRVG